MCTPMIVDRAGYRLNVGIILLNASGRVFWGRRHGHENWQFPQGGLASGESPVAAMYRELHEEIGLTHYDVKIIGVTKYWLKYRLPAPYARNGITPLIIGQKQKWYLLKLISSEQKLRLDLSDAPEFDSWRWIDCNDAPKQIIFFKKQVYVQALDEFKRLLEKTANHLVRSTTKPITLVKGMPSKC